MHPWKLGHICRGPFGPDRRSKPPRRYKIPVNPAINQFENSHHPYAIVKEPHVQVAEAPIGPPASPAPSVSLSDPLGWGIFYSSHLESALQGHSRIFSNFFFTRRFRPPTAAPPRGTIWRRSGSNRRPLACKASALPTELRPRRRLRKKPPARRMPRRKGPKSAIRRTLGLDGIEPTTSPLSGVRSNQLSYRPAIHVCGRPGHACKAPTGNTAIPRLFGISTTRPKPYRPGGSAPPVGPSQPARCAIVADWAQPSTPSFRQTPAFS